MREFFNCDNNCKCNQGFTDNKSKSSNINKNSSISKKTIAIISVIILVIIAIAFVVSRNNELHTELIRIHIRANSNSEEDQAVKLLVRDSVTEYLTVELESVQNREEAYDRLLVLQESIRQQAIRVLQQQGFYYGASITINNEYFPTRTYEGIVVDSGYYDAVIIELGDGVGDNWWCVVYPPLCFVTQGTGTYWEYRSKLKEIWDKFFH